MQKNETQQFAKFFLKDIKTKYAIDAVYNLGNKFYDSLAAGNNLETAANDVGAKFEKFTEFDLLGRDKEGNPINNLPIMPEFLETAFNTEESEISELVESIGNIMFAVRVDRILPSTTKSLKQAREEIITDIKNQLIAKSSENYAKNFIEEIKKGKDFESTANDYKAKSLNIESFDRNGKSTEESVSLPLVEKAFAMNLNDISSPISYGNNNYAVIKLLNIIPFKSSEFDKEVDFDLLGTFQQDITDALIMELRNTYSIKINQNILQNF